MTLDRAAVPAPLPDLPDEPDVPAVSAGAVSVGAAAVALGGVAPDAAVLGRVLDGLRALPTAPPARDTDDHAGDGAPLLPLPRRHR